MERVVAGMVSDSVRSVAEGDNEVESVGSGGTNSSSRCGGLARNFGRLIGFRDVSVRLGYWRLRSGQQLTLGQGAI